MPRKLCFGEVVQHGPRGFSRSYQDTTVGEAEDLLDREVSASSKMKHSSLRPAFFHPAFAGRGPSVFRASRRPSSFG